MTTIPRSSPPIIWEHNLEVADQIVQCVEEGRYCALLGPRFWGKTSLLTYIQHWMEENSRPCVRINLFEIKAQTQLGFFANLAQAIAQDVSRYTDHPMEVPAGQINSSSFRAFLAECVDHLGVSLTVIFDHLEGLQTDLNRALLTSLRALHMEQGDKEPRFIAIVSGALSLAALTVGETSPFHGIADRILLVDLNAEKSAAIASQYLQSTDIQVSEKARTVLLDAARGNPNLIKLICKRSLEIAANNPSRSVTAQTVKRAVRQFLFVEAPHYGPLQEAIRLTEEDPELLQCILKLLKKDIVPRSELPLKVFPDLDPLYLTGLVERVGEASYRIRNGIYRQYLSEYFDAAKTGYLLTVSGRWDAAISLLEESVLSGNEQSRTDLQAATISAMYASDSPEQAAYYILRGLSAAFGVSEISIWLVTPDGQSLVLLDQKGTSVVGALPVGIEAISIAADSAEARSYRQNCILREEPEEACARYVFPLMVPGQAPVGVVALSDCMPGDTVTEYHKREFQLQSYINQAGRALYEVEFRRKREDRASKQDEQLEKQTEQLLLLHRVSTLSQTIPDLEKVLHLILTAITAHFGLGFNRAWLLILNREKKRLTGRMGIGNLTEEQAYQAWSSLPTFEEYVENLYKGLLVKSKIDPLTRTLSFPVSEDGQDLFSIAVTQLHTFHWSGAQGHWHEIPQEFRQAFDPGEMILTPLVIRNSCLGLIAVDSKFRPRSYTETDDLLLKTFANQMATAIFNIQQHDHELQRLKLEETLRETSRVIESSLDSKEVLQRILEEMKKVLPFDSASIQLANGEENCLRIIASKGFKDPHHVETLKFPIDGNYPNTLVYKSKEPLHLEDVQERFANFADPYYQVTDVHGWLGAPLISNDKVIGVITLDSKTLGIYTAEHDRMAILFAGQASVAIENARLYEAEKKTREYLDLLISSSQDGIIAVDNKGNVDRYSEGAQKILGYSLEEVKRRRVDQLYGSLDVAREINSMLKASDKVRDYPTSILDNEGQPVPILLSATLLRDKTGKPVGSVGFFKDLRPLKKVENDLRMMLDTVSVMSRIDQSERGLNALAKRIVSAQPVTFCSILLLDDGKQNLVVKALYPIPRPLGRAVKWDHLVEKRIPLAYEGLMSHLINLPNAQVFQKGSEIKGVDVIQEIQKDILIYDELRSALIVPLKAGSEVFGICILGEARSWGRSPFDEEKVELISSMVTQGMVFVDRLRAHEATQNKLMMVERLRSIGEDLVAASSGSTKEILDKVVRAAYEVMGASSTIIYPWDQEMKTYDTEKIAHFGLRKPKAFSGKVRREDGSMTQIVLRKKIVIVDDIHKGWDRKEKTRIWVDPGSFLDNEGVKAFVGVSLESGEEQLGVLYVNYSEPHFFADSELEAINLFANQAIIAIENAHLYEDLQRRLEESQTLQQVGIFLANTRDLEQVLNRVMQAAFDLIHADMGNILFYEAGRDEFEELALTSSERDQPLRSYKTRVRQRTGYSYEIIKTKKPIRVYDTRLDSSINPVMLEKGRRGSLGVPLIGPENPVGVLWVHWKNPHRVSEREERLLMALASQAAVAIENATLYEQRNQESQSLQRVGISLTESFEQNQVLYRVLQAALGLVDGDEDTILFYDERRDEFDENGLICKGLDQPLEPYRTKVRQKKGLAHLVVQNKEPIIIPDARLDGRVSRVAIDKGRCAMVGVPLLDHEGAVGVLWVNWKQPRQISARDVSLLTALASQATVAIKGVRRYEELQRRSAHLDAAHEAGKVITAASVGLDRQQILDRILKEAIESVTDLSGGKASFGTISLVEGDPKELVVKSVYSKRLPQLSIDKFERILVDPRIPQVKRIGISGRAVITGQAQLVPDVNEDPDYIVLDENTKSELVIPLVDNDTVIGVMDVESDELAAFDELDKDALTLLVDLAVVALNNTRRAEELTRSNAVALMSAWGAEIAHDVNREVSYIWRDIFVLQKRPDLPSDVKDRLHRIEQSTGRLAMPKREIDTESWLPMQNSCNLSHTIEAAVSIYQDSDPGSAIAWEYIPFKSEVKVAIHERRLLSILSHLFRNATQAMAQVEEKRVHIRTSVMGKRVAIEVEDSGPGVPPEIRDRLFREPVAHEQDRKGSGLLLIRFISEQYRGSVELAEPRNGSGACFRVWLPVVVSEGISE